MGVQISGQTDLSDYGIRYLTIPQNQNVSHGSMDLTSQVTYTESDNQYLSNDNYRSQVYVVSDHDKEEKLVDLTRLFMNKDSYLKGSIAGADDVDFYSFSINGYLGKFDKSISITLEGVGNSEFDMAVYDQYGNQVGIGEKDADGNLNIRITNITPGSDKYYIKIQGKDAGAASDNEYHLKLDWDDADNSSGNEMWNEMINVVNKMRDKAAKGESFEAEKNELNKIHENQILEYEKNVKENQAKQYEKINGPENENYDENYDCGEILGKVSDGNDITEQEEDYLNIFANMFSYEQAKAQGNIVKTGNEIKEILQKAGITDWDSIAIYRGEDGEFYVSGIEDASVKENVENEINAAYKDKLYQLFLSGSEELNQDSLGEYRSIIKKQELNDYLYKVSGGEISMDDITVDPVSGKIQGLPAKIEALVNNPGDNYKYKDIREKIYEVKNYERQTGDKIPGVDCRYQFINGKLQIA